MRVVVQKVKRAAVSSNGKLINKINNGYYLLVGITHTDNEEIAYKLALKISKLRIFEDNEGKLNLSIKDVNGEILSISQFTLYADAKKGNRPSFVLAAKKDLALPLYNKFNEMLNELGIKTYEGQFGEYMEIDCVNDGPATILLEEN